ncbi:uncharacterized protein METZ01_LOCUS326937, partial [marine metagenome]
QDNPGIACNLKYGGQQILKLQKR